MPPSKYILSAASAYFLWGFFSFGSKPISHYDLVLASSLLWVINLLFRRSKGKGDIQLFQSLDNKSKKKDVGYLFLAALVLMVNWLSFIFVINRIGVQTAGFSYLICPILASLLGFMILKEQMSKEKWIAICLSVVACIMLSYGHFHEMYFSLLVAFSFAYYLTLQRRLNKYDSLNLLTIQVSIVTIFLLPYYIFSEHRLIQDGVFYYYIGIIVVFFTIIPMFLNNYALKGINASTAGILIYLNPIVNFLLATLYFKEEVSWVQLSAYTIIGISVMLYNYKLFLKKA
jgi:chloramphenicol-sensitive protein RarD